MEETKKGTKNCRHALMADLEGDTTILYWNCIYCGAVAFFDPATQRMLIPRES